MLGLINVISKKPTAKVVLTEKVENFPPKIKKKTRILSFYSTLYSRLLPGQLRKKRK